MTLFEGAVILMLLLVLAGLVVLRVRSGDEAPSRPLPPPISGGAVGAELVGVASDDCIDAILFDFGPGSEAYFVYTRGRPMPKSRRG